VISEGQPEKAVGKMVGLLACSKNSDAYQYPSLESRIIAHSIYRKNRRQQKTRLKAGFLSEEKSIT